MPKVAFIGGGSSKFVRELVVDLFSFPELQDLDIALMDIDAERVDRSRRIVEKIIADRKLGATVVATTDRRAALDGADYVVVTIMVGGFKHYHSDIAIPAKYGVFQAVSDTIGPGGVFRLVRTAPVLEGIARDLSELAPDAWLLNYANPMSMNIWALLDAGHKRSVGLCHSIQGTAPMLGRWVGVPGEEVRYAAAGINHVNFYLQLEHGGRDLYPDLLAAAPEVLAKEPYWRPSFELLEYLGHFPAEGPWHQSEYAPWFRKDQERIDHYAVETWWGYNHDMKHNELRAAEIEDQLAGRKPIGYERTSEYGAPIIHSLHTGELRSFYGSVRNAGLIDNLPATAVVEVPCMVDANGVLPCRMGAIPPQLAALMRSHVSVHEMAVAGAAGKDRDLIRQAIQADPLTGAILTLPQIRDMVGELFEENADYVSDWA